MALIVKDRVRETTTTAGTGTFSLAGAVTGFDAFSVIGNSNTTYYAVVHRTANEWEVGIGTYTSSGATLARTTILASSNSGSAQSFAAGTKDVFCTYPSGKSVYADASGVVNISSVAITGGTVSGITDLTVNGDITFSGAVPEILGGDADGELFIGPSTTNALGGNVVLYGQSHASKANDIELGFDSSASVWSVEANELNLNSGQSVRWGGNGNNRISGNGSTNIVSLYSAGVLTATFDASNNTTLGGDLIFSPATPEIRGGDADGELFISPSTTNALGGNVVLYGQSHASKANDIEFRATAATELGYDDSASTWNFAANTIQTTGGLTVGLNAAPNYVAQFHSAASHGLIQLTNAATGSAGGDGSYIGVLNTSTTLRVWNQEAAPIWIGSASGYAVFTNGAVTLGGTLTFADGSAQTTAGASTGKAIAMAMVFG